jgi:hypothetical protein
MSISFEFLYGHLSLPSSGPERDVVRAIVGCKLELILGASQLLTAAFINDGLPRPAFNRWAVVTMAVVGALGGR